MSIRFSFSFVSKNANDKSIANHCINRLVTRKLSSRLSYSKAFVAAETLSVMLQRSSVKEEEGCSCHNDIRPMYSLNTIQPNIFHFELYYKSSGLYRRIHTRFKVDKPLGNWPAVAIEQTRKRRPNSGWQTHLS